ncbi:MAG: serpin family protein [Acidimicrobiales bacterium]
MRWWSSFGPAGPRACLRSARRGAAAALTAALAVAGLSSSASAAAPGTAPVAAIIGAEQGFALDLLHRLAPGLPNLVLSPSSIATLLAMLEPGAAGQTEAGIAQALGSMGISPQQQALAWRSLNATLAGQAVRDHVVFDTANELWLQTGFPVRSSYLALLGRDFAAGVKEQDLREDPAGSAQAIDDWVASRTAGHITNLLTPAELQDVVTVMVDAVYMNAPWQTPFDPSLTMAAPFYLSSGATTQVPMMSTSQPLDVPVSATATLDAAELPYKGDDLSALVLMPPLGHLGAFENQLSPASLAGILSGLGQQRADIKLPKFKLQSSLRLNQVLSEMGMSQAFSLEADFAPLSPRSLELSFVVHDAQMNVSEKGTEASAATGGGLTPTAMPAPPPVTIVFNHPFLFLVRDNSTGTVIFEAQVDDPSSARG